ncbi:MAG: DUF3025 domain-containing protein [Burkholderiaceae bacterium]
MSQQVDWAAPWLAPFCEAGHVLEQRILTGASVCLALNGAGASGVTFVPQRDLPNGRAYEQFIFDTGQVPTRENLHDFFNGLVWLHLPLAKRRMNQLQAQAIAAQGVGAVRGPLRDALTLFDENGALLDAPAPLWQALRARDWRRLFVDLRPLWAQARLLLVGHALMEKLVLPRKGIAAHVYQAPAAIETIAKADAWLATELQPGRWAQKPFVPLPVMGIPGWCHGNDAVSFYDDLSVFRRTAARPA